MRRFDDKIVLVTGASAGIGKAAGIAFAGEGACVVLVARREDRLRQIAQSIHERGGRAMALAADITDRAEVSELVEVVLNTYGRIDILVNNAGIGLLSAVVDMVPSELQRVMDVNFYGLVWVTQSVLPQMIARRTGQIINVSSIVGQRAVPQMSAYCASKFAVQAFSESLRIEVAPHNIDVIVVCPSSTDTEFNTTPLMDRPINRVKWYATSADRVAAVIVKASVRRKREVVVTLSGKGLVWANRLAPKLLDRVMGYLWARKPKRSPDA